MFNPIVEKIKILVNISLLEEIQPINRQIELPTFNDKTSHQIQTFNNIDELGIHTIQ